MKHFLRTALLVASALAYPAFAQDAPPAVDGATVPADPGLTGSTNAAVSLDDVLSSIRAGKTNIGAIESLSSVSEVEVVRVAHLAGGADKPALEAAISENKVDIAALQKVIAENPALKAELDATSIAVSDVVAANVEADGSLTVFAR